jgi:uncharacterized membrane protein
MEVTKATEDGLLGKEAQRRQRHNGINNLVSLNYMLRNNYIMVITIAPLWLEK